MNIQHSLLQDTVKKIDSPTLQFAQLMHGFRIVVVVFIIAMLFALVEKDVIDVIGASCIITAAMLPLYLWCSGRAGGMPIYPLYALTFVWTYAFPLLSYRSEIFLYDSEDRLFASLTTAAFLLIGTAAWYRYTRYTPTPALLCRSMREDKGDLFFLLVLAIALLFTVSNNAGWLQVSGGSFAIIRGFVLGLSSLAVFVLSYRMGTGRLSGNALFMLLVLLPAYILANAVSLLLIGSMTTFVLAVVAYTIGRKKIPWVTIVIAAVIFSLLHNGKGLMRQKYWGSRVYAVIQPWHYPAVMAEWVGYSLKHLGTSSESSSTGQNIFERASLIHLFLKVQNESPDRVPYLQGATYAIIPELFIPRIFKANKIASHEGTYLLNIQYGMQTRGDVIRTTIAWGMLNEAYANFGVLGCFGLALILGSIYGKVAQWSMNYPVLSMRTLVALLFLAFSMQAEFTSGVLVAALFQSLMALGVVAVFLMKNQYVSADIQEG